MSQERLQGRDVLMAIVDNMRDGLEPLVTEVVAPSLYQVYLHPDDYDRLESLFPRLTSEAGRLLDRELQALNRSSVPLPRRLLSLVRGKPGEIEGIQRYGRAGGSWQVEFQVDPNDSLAPGEVEVVSDFAARAPGEYGAGSETRRIERPTYQTTRSRRKPREEDAYARISYEDQDGARTFLMTKEEIVIGREGATDVWVDLPLKTHLDISREHARIRRDPDTGRFFIKDLSLLGTAVEGRKLPCSREVIDGDDSDRHLWVELPDDARIQLAEVLELHFQGTHLS